VPSKERTFLCTLKGKMLFPRFFTKRKKGKGGKEEKVPGEFLQTLFATDHSKEKREGVTLSSYTGEGGEGVKTIERKKEGRRRHSQATIEGVSLM